MEVEEGVNYLILSDVWRAREFNSAQLVKIVIGRGYLGVLM